MILLLAIVMGGITTVLFYSYMKQYDATAAISENMVEVVVAIELLQKNERISTDKVEIRSIPELSLHPQAATSIEQLEGLILNADIEKDEVILLHRVQREEDENLLVSRKIKEGYRAVSVGVNFVQSVSNLVEPEDYVDVIFSEVIKSDGETVVNTKLIFEKIRILAVGRKLIESTTGEIYMEYSSATLELTAEAAVMLVNASERGTIQLSLHSRVEEQ